MSERHEAVLAVIVSMPGFAHPTEGCAGRAVVQEDVVDCDAARGSVVKDCGYGELRDRSIPFLKASPTKVNFGLFPAEDIDAQRVWPLTNLLDCVLNCRFDDGTDGAEELF